MLENNCSESASRMSAMENSTKSAGEMLSKLTLAYNRCVWLSWTVLEGLSTAGAELIRVSTAGVQGRQCAVWPWLGACQQVEVGISAGGCVQTPAH